MYSLCLYFNVHAKMSLIIFFYVPLLINIHSQTRLFNENLLPIRPISYSNFTFSKYLSRTQTLLPDACGIIWDIYLSTMKFWYFAVASKAVGYNHWINESN